MMHIAHAILHAFDFESGSTSFSQRELDLDTRAVKSYVQRHMRKISSSAENRHGEFSAESGFRLYRHSTILWVASGWILTA